MCNQNPKIVLLFVQHSLWQCIKGGSKSQYREFLFTDLCVPYMRVALYWSLYLFKEGNIFIQDFFTLILLILTVWCTKYGFISGIFRRVNHTFDNIDWILRFIINIVLLWVTLNSWSHARSGGAHCAKLQAQGRQWRVRAVCRHTRGWERCMSRRQWWTPPLQVSSVLVFQKETLTL